MTDLLFMALADEKFVEAERREIRALADALNLTDPQLAALEKYVQAVLKAGKADGVGAEDFKKLGGDVAASLAATGIPIAAVAVSGTVFGLSAAGITSGLAALGLGLGMASGLGVAVAIGVGSFFSVRWLYRRVVGA
jgi:small-conductance mechanosensitive channel